MQPSKQPCRAVVFRSLAVGRSLTARHSRLGGCTLPITPVATPLARAQNSYAIHTWSGLGLGGWGEGEGEGEGEG